MTNEEAQNETTVEANILASLRRRHGLGIYVLENFPPKTVARKVLDRLRANGTVVIVGDPPEVDSIEDKVFTAEYAKHMEDMNLVRPNPDLNADPWRDYYYQ